MTLKQSCSNVVLLT